MVKHGDYHFISGFKTKRQQSRPERTNVQKEREQRQKYAWELCQPEFGQLFPESALWCWAEGGREEEGACSLGCERSHNYKIKDVGRSEFQVNNLKSATAIVMWNS